MLIGYPHMRPLDWPSYWNASVPENWLLTLEVELRRELPVGHALHGRRCVAKAIGRDPDDVVFELEDGSLAAVHLTWKAETNALWPFALLFDDLKSVGQADEWDDRPL